MPIALVMSHFSRARVPQWVAAVLAILYGFAKINGSQFTILDSELARPMGDVSGFWLTWYYFGYSAVYGTLLALIQIGAGILIVVPRTKLVAALILLPVVVNIVLIDIFYGVDFGGLAAAVVLLTCVIMTVAPHARRLTEAVLLERSGPPAMGTIVAVAVIAAGSFAFTWWVANHNNRAPTEIDGAWTVTEQTGDSTRWEVVFFERNRAYMVVFRRSQGPDARHHFEIDRDGTVRIWEHWLRKGELIMEGRVVSPTQMVLQRLRDGGRLVLTRPVASR